MCAIAIGDNGGYDRYDYIILTEMNVDESERCRNVHILTRDAERFLARRADVIETLEHVLIIELKFEN